MSERSHFGRMDASPTLADTWRASRPGRIPNVPALPRRPLVGNALEFRKDRLALQARLADLGPIARFHMGPLAVHAIADGRWRRRCWSTRPMRS